MASIYIETRINAPIARVFDLARSIDAHMVSTGDTNERAVAGRTTGLIEAGESVTWEAKHFGVTQRLTVRITDMERPFLLADEMVSGTFSSMQHTHHFSQDHAVTLMKDEFHFTAPLGILGRIAERLFLTRYMKNFLIQRSLVLKQLAESDEWQRFLAGDTESTT